ncbi:MAG: RNA polymerase sigma factor [Acidimicrobiales bacterium]
MEADPRVERVRATYESTHAPLWRAVLAYSSSAEVADEAVAEAFAQLLRRGDGVDDPAAWVWRSAFRIAAGDLKRRGARRSGHAMPDVGVWVPEPAFDLMAALRHLTHQQRACVVLCDLADHSAVEAARLLGTTAATVRVQRMRARRRLRDLLEDPDA